MKPIVMEYEGHSVMIHLDYDRRNKPQYWVRIDDRPVFFVSNADTAKRLALRFIDVLIGEDFLVARQGKTSQLLNH